MPFLFAGENIYEDESMKKFSKWRNLAAFTIFLSVLTIGFLIFKQQYLSALVVAVLVVLLMVSFYGFWRSLHRYGLQTEVDISRVLGRDAKEALDFGNIGILTYDSDYVVTWQSPYFEQNGMHLVNQKLASWMAETKTLFSDEVDTVTGKYEDRVYEITRKADAQILYVKDITELYNLRAANNRNEIVVGILELDNYREYQNYEGEELLAKINMHLRGPLVVWAKKNGMLIKKLSSDRFFVVLNKQIFDDIKAKNFSILQEIKDRATDLDVSITLSMAFAYGTDDFVELDDMVNQLIELAQSRGGDQAVIRSANGTVQYIGGNSEISSTRSKVRVRVMARTIEEAILQSNEIYIAGHIMTDFDCMGAALSMSSWAQALNKKAYIVLRDVARDAQLQDTMEHYRESLRERHHFLTPDQALERFNKDKALLLMVDHGIPSISSCKEIIPLANRIVVIDHHRRGDSFVKHAMLTYVESTASSACELIVELLQNVSSHVPIFQSEATIMYLGILVDTNRFQMHTDARTFEAAGMLCVWGANSTVAERSLREDFTRFTLRNTLVQLAKPYKEDFLIVCYEDGPVDKTILAQTSEALLKVKGCKASFTIARADKDGFPTAVSARSDGTYNVQKVMEKLQGGGHFSAAAAESSNMTPKELKKALLAAIDQEEMV